MGKGGYEHCTGCPKYLKAGVSLGDVRVDPLFVVRLQHLVRLEAMHNVGCTFGPNDLSPYEWDELIVLAQERQRMDEAVRKHRDKIQVCGPDGRDRTQGHRGPGSRGVALLGQEGGAAVMVGLLSTRA